jgi:Protein kinase domain
MTHAHPSRGELEAFDRGLLRPVQWTEIEHHVADCDTCCRVLEDAPDDALVTLLKGAEDPLLSGTVASGPAMQETPVARAPKPPRLVSEPPAELSDHPRYHVLEMLGSGGMGTVFKAEHRLMQRIVALKVIHADLLATPEGVERFRQEARAAALLAHPNIATAYDADQAGSAHFLVMEFAEGETLDRVLEQRGPLPWQEASALIRQVAEGLQHAYERAMVHRDLKPANLLLTLEGQIKILDFGLARLLSEPPGPGPTVTPVGAVIGTPQYLAPEQARTPQSADVRADLYSLGCTWYEMLSGQPPFAQGTLLQQLLAHQDQSPRPVTDYCTDLPPQMSGILHRLLEKDPAKRWQTPAELLEALEPCATPAVSQGAAPEIRALWGFAYRTVIIAMILSASLLCLLVWAGWHWLAVAPRPGDENRPNVGLETAAPTMPVEEATASTKTASDIVKSQPVKDTLLSAQAQAIAWLAANNRFGPDSQLVEDNARKLNKGVTAGKAFVLQLGPKLTKSAQPTVLAGRQQDFFVFELPPGSLPIDESRAILTTSGEQNQQFQAPFSIRLADLRIDQEEIDGTMLSGSVAYRVSTPVSGRLAARLTVMIGKSTKTMYDLLETKNLSGEGTARFHFKSLYAQQSRAKGPVAFFLDLASVGEPGSNANALVLSNDLAALVVNQKATLPNSP